MFGFKFDRNFHQPYLAQGASEFWRRWHITLSRWFQDNVYIPMGGGKGPRGRVVINLAVVMLLSGLWHGAGWNFLLWGGLHGTCLILQRLFPSWGPRWLYWPKVLGFQAFVMLCWVPFREPSLHAFWNGLCRGSAWLGPESLMALGWLLALILFSKVEDLLERRFVRLTVWTMRQPLALFAVVYGSILVFIFIGAGSATTFIYQRF
jgi:alginate O-acetyltransferase complex protein AlgI